MNNYLVILEDGRTVIFQAESMNYITSRPRDIAIISITWIREEEKG